MKWPREHFFRQFNRYAEGQPRFEAVAEHAAYLLNRIDTQREEEVKRIVSIRDALIAGRQPAEIAIMIQQYLNEIEEGSPAPDLSALP